MNKLLLNIKGKLMAFGNIFKDDNNINEKSVVGFASFAIMVIFAVADIITGWMGNPLHVNEFHLQFIFMDYIRKLRNCRSR